MSSVFLWRGQSSGFVKDKRFTWNSTAPVNPAPSRTVIVRKVSGSINTETCSAADKSARIQGKSNAARSQ